MIKQFQKKSNRWSVLGVASVITLLVFSLLNTDNFNKNQNLKVEANVFDSKEQSDKTFEKTNSANNQANTNTETRQNDQLEETSNDYSTYPYIIFNGYYYIKGDQVEQSRIGAKIGEVKRIGNWEIKKDGDSNEVPPGPIYSVFDKDPKEVIVAKQWSNRDVYVLFEKKGPINQPDKSTIFSSKNDPEEVRIAIQNVREKSSVLYEFKDQGRFELFFVSYDPKHRSSVSLAYSVSEADTSSVQGILSVMQYPKNDVPEASEFIEKKVYKDKNSIEWKNPVLKESFTVNGMEWGKYETFNYETVYRGEQQNLYFEIKTQGEIDINLMRDFLSSYKQSND